MSDTWRNAIVKALAEQPEEWRLLGAVFGKAIHLIPLHTALRAAADTARQRARAKGIELDTVYAHDLDVFKAKWLTFTGWVLPLIERQTAGVRAPAKPGERVRLKPSGTCEECGGPTYLTEWCGDGKRGRTKGVRQTACPRCAVRPKPSLVAKPRRRHRSAPAYHPANPLDEAIAAYVASIDDVPAPAPPPEKKKHTYRRRGPAPVTPTPVPVPVPIPPPRVIEPPPVITMNSVNDIWKNFKKSVSLPKFLHDDKLYRQAQRAFNAGVVAEYKSLTFFRDSEFLILGVSRELDSLYKIHTPRMNQVFVARGTMWVNATITSQFRKYWSDVLTEAYAYGASAVFLFVLHDQLETIRDDIDRLINRLEPKPKPQQQPKKTWIAATKEAVGRWVYR